MDTDLDFSSVPMKKDKGAANLPATLDFSRVPKKGQKQSYGAGLLDRLTDGAALGWGEEATALEAALLGKTPDGKWFDYSAGENLMEGMGKRYNDALAAERAQSGKFKAENPKASLAAEITGSVLLPAGAARRGFSLMRPSMGTGATIGAGALEGASYGIVAGAGFGDDNRLQGAVEGGAAGMVLGGTLPAVIQGGRSLLRGATGRAQRASDKIIQEALNHDGMVPKDALKQLDKLGPKGFPMDIGKNLEGTAEGLYSIPGKQKTMIGDALYNRNSGSNRRILSTLDTELGLTPSPTQIARQNKTNAQNISPIYNQVLDNGRQADTSILIDVLDDAIKSRRGPAQQAIRDVRKMLLEEGTEEISTSPRVLMSTRQAVDGMKSAAERAGNNDVAGALGTIRGEIDNILTEAVDDVKTVDAARRELFRQEDGFEEGLSLFQNKRGGLTPKEFSDRFTAGAVPKGKMIGPSAESFMIRQAARLELDRVVGTSANDKRALANLLKEPEDWNYQKMVTVFGQKRTDAIRDILVNEARFQGTKNSVTGGSPTTPRAERIRYLSGENGVSGTIRDAANFQFGDAGAKIAGKIAKTFSAPGIQRRNEHLAKSLIDRAEFERSLARNNRLMATGGDNARSRLSVAPTASIAGQAQSREPLQLDITLDDWRRANGVR